MLIRPWDRAISDTEWRGLASRARFRAAAVNDAQRKAELLRRQLAHFQPQGDHARVAVDMPPYGRMLSGIRGLRLQITSVAAKFKYDDHNPQEHRATVAERLEGRGSGRDRSAAAQALQGNR
jgi:transcriptional regulator